VKQYPIWGWHERGHVICVTTNGATRKDGTAIMGAGIAKATTQRFPGFDARLGTALRNGGNQCYFWADLRLITFPTKHHWQQEADLALIETSARQLANWVSTSLRVAPTTLWPVCLPAPGCENGKRTRSEVEPVLTKVFQPAGIEHLVQVFW
jgi:hypothetical protein